MEDHEIDRSLEGVFSREIGYLFYYFHHRQALSYELHYFQNTFYIYSLMLHTITWNIIESNYVRAKYFIEERY